MRWETKEWRDKEKLNKKYMCGNCNIYIKI